MTLATRDRQRDLKNRPMRSETEGGGGVQSRELRPRDGGQRNLAVSNPNITSAAGSGAQVPTKVATPASVVTIAIPTSVSMSG